MKPEVELRSSPSQIAYIRLYLNRHSGARIGFNHLLNHVSMLALDVNPTSLAHSPVLACPGTGLPAP